MLCRYGFFRFFFSFSQESKDGTENTNGSPSIPKSQRCLWFTIEFVVAAKGKQVFKSSGNWLRLPLIAPAVATTTLKQLIMYFLVR